MKFAGSRGTHRTIIRQHGLKVFQRRGFHRLRPTRERLKNYLARGTGQTRNPAALILPLLILLILLWITVQSISDILSIQTKISERLALLAPELTAVSAGHITSSDCTALDLSQRALYITGSDRINSSLRIIQQRKKVAVVLPSSFVHPLLQALGGQSPRRIRRRTRHIVQRVTQLVQIGCLSLRRRTRIIMRVEQPGANPRHSQGSRSHQTASRKNRGRHTVDFVFRGLSGRCKPADMTSGISENTSVKFRQSFCKAA